MMVAIYGSPGLPEESPRAPGVAPGPTLPYVVSTLRSAGRLVCTTRVAPDGTSYIRLSLDGRLLVESVFDPTKPLQLELDL